MSSDVHEDVRLTEEQLDYLHDLLSGEDRNLRLFIDRWKGKKMDGVAETKANRKIEDGQRRKAINSSLLEVLEHHIEVRG